MPIFFLSTHGSARVFIASMFMGLFICVNIHPLSLKAQPQNISASMHENGS